MSTNTPVLSRNTKEYRRRKPQYGPYYQCIEDYYEEFNRSYERNFSQKYGYCGKRINPGQARSTENLARYIIRASFSQERMDYFPDKAKVTYQSKYGKDVKEFSCLEWMAALVSHIPDRGGQTVRYYGHYSNVTRGRLKKEEDEPQYYIIEDDSPGDLNRSWARLIQKIYEVDPLTCPKCGGDMRIIAFIEDYKIVKKILDWLGIFEFSKKRAPPRMDTTPDDFDEYIIDDYIDCDHVC